MKRLSIALLALVICSRGFNLSAQNHKPIANAGADNIVNECASFSFIGKGTDADHDRMTYRWIVPEELIFNVERTNVRTLPCSGINVDEDKTFPFIFIVNDGKIDSDPDTAYVTIKKLPNFAPKIDTIIYPLVDRPGKTPTLFVVAKDTNCSDLIHYKWTGPKEITLLTADRMSCSFITPVVTKPTKFSFEIKVTDDEGLSDDSIIFITIEPNKPPIANAGNDTIITSCENLQLGYFRSTDPTNDPLKTLWEQSSDQPFWLDQYSLTPSTIVTEPKDYYVRLTVSDGEFESSDTLKVTVIPETTQPIVEKDYSTPDTIELKGRDHLSLMPSAYDPSNKYLNLSYEWNVPKNMGKVIANTYDLEMYMKPVAHTTLYPVKVVAKNCQVTSDTLIYNIRVWDSINPRTPPILSNLDYCVNTGDKVLLSITIDHNLLDAITYNWKSLNGIVLSSTTTANPSFVAPYVTKDSILKFELKVSDGTFTVTDTCKVTVRSKQSILKLSVDSCYMQLKNTFGLDFQKIYYYLDDRCLSMLDNPYLYFGESNYSVLTFYNGLYSGALSCTEQLKKLNSLSISQTVKDQWTGELKFLRGLFNFYIYICFKNAPVVTDNIEYSQANDGFPNWYKLDTFYVSSVSDYKTAIENDLTQAIELLPATRLTNNPEKPTSFAARALLGKMYLYMQDWENAKIQFESIISSGKFSLSSPKGNKPIDFINAYLSNFSYLDLPASGGSMYKSEFNDESVIEVEYSDSININSWIIGFFCSGNELMQFFSPHNFGFKTVEPNPLFADIYKKNGAPIGFEKDPRCIASFYSNGDSMDFRPGTEYSDRFKVGRNTINLGKSYGYPKSYGIKKYYYPVYSDKPEAPQNSPNNWRIIRYSDVLLMYAEAQYHLGNNQSALDALNQVRNRVGMTPITSITPAAIMHERDVELGFECVRFHDLVRWSQLTEPWVKIDTIDSRFVIGKNEYLPIPLARKLFTLSNNIIPADATNGTFIGVLKDNAAGEEVKYYISFANSNMYYISNDSLFIKKDISKIEDSVFYIQVNSVDKGWNQNGQFFDLIKTPCSSVPIHRTNEVNFKIYPNPTSGLIKIESGEASKSPISIKVFDLQGRMLSNFQYGKGFTNGELNLQGLSDGMVLVTIWDGGRYEVHKVIIKK